MGMLRVTEILSLRFVWEGLEVWWDGLLTSGPMLIWLEEPLGEELE